MQDKPNAPQNSCSPGEVTENLPMATRRPVILGERRHLIPESVGGERSEDRGTDNDRDMSKTQLAGESSALARTPRAKVPPRRRRRKGKRWKAFKKTLSSPTVWECLGKFIGGIVSGWAHGPK